MNPVVVRVVCLLKIECCSLAYRFQSIGNLRYVMSCSKPTIVSSLFEMQILIANVLLLLLHLISFPVVHLHACTSWRLIIRSVTVITLSRLLMATSSASVDPSSLSIIFCIVFTAMVFSSKYSLFVVFKKFTKFYVSAFYVFMIF